MILSELWEKGSVLAIFAGLLMLLLIPSCIGQASMHQVDAENCTDGIADASFEQASENASFAANSFVEPVGQGLVEPTLISPEDAVNTGKPTYIWNGVDDCLYYCLIVTDDQDNVILKQWYDASDFPPAPEECSVTPSQVLDPGDYKWCIKCWNCLEDITSQEMKFTVCTSKSLPGKATLVSPKNAIGNKNPTFIWNAVAGCTRYCLKVANVNSLNAPVFQECYDASEVLSGKVCSVTPVINLKAGSYRWWIQTTNCKGDGPWSDFMAFRYLKQLPGKSTPISPKGLISSSQPTFTWTAATLAAEYRLQIDNDTENIMDEMFDAAEVTSGVRCSAILTSALPDDDSVYYWRIQAINSAGDGPWSSYRYFETVCPMKPGARKK